MLRRRGAARGWPGRPCRHERQQPAGRRRRRLPAAERRRPGSCALGPPAPASAPRSGPPTRSSTRSRRRRRARPAARDRAAEPPSRSSTSRSRASYSCSAIRRERSCGCSACACRPCAPPTSGRRRPPAALTVRCARAAPGRFRFLGHVAPARPSQPLPRIQAGWARPSGWKTHHPSSPGAAGARAAAPRLEVFRAAGVIIVLHLPVRLAESPDFCEDAFWPCAHRARSTRHGSGTFCTLGSRPSSRVVKRALDLIAGSLLARMTAPTVGVLALLVRRDGGRLSSCSSASGSRAPVRARQAADDAGRRLGGLGRRSRRSARDAAGARAAPDPPRRASAVPPRPAGRDEPRRAPARAAGLRRPARAGAPLLRPPAPDQARHPRAGPRCAAATAESEGGLGLEAVHSLSSTAR